MQKACFIYGDDEYMVDQKAKSYFKPKESIEAIDGNISTIADLQRCIKKFREAVLTVDFFSNEKWVWLKNVRFFEPSGLAFTAGGQTELENFSRLLGHIPQGVRVLISAFPIDKRSKIFKSLEEELDCDCVTKTEESIFALIHQISVKYAVEISAEASELLSRKLNGQPRAIVNELEKLCTWAGSNHKIDLKVVQQLTPALPSEEFFEPIEAFYSEDLQWTLNSFRNFFLYQKEFRGLLTALQNRNRLLIQLKVLQKNERTFNKLQWQALLEQYKPTFGGDYQEKNSLCIFTQNPWFLGKLKSGYRLEKLLFIQEILLETFEKLLRTPKIALFLMENMILRVFSF